MTQVVDLAEYNVQTMKQDGLVVFMAACFGMFP